FSWVPFSRVLVMPNATSCCGAGNGSGFNRSALTTLKIAVFAPIPRASVNAAIVVNAGDFRRVRRANLKSAIIKFQIPKPKFQGNPKLQIPMSGDESWRLGFGISLEIGTWDLGFSFIP